MLNEHDLQGVFVPVVTPFFVNDELDLQSFEHYVAGLQGLVINGTTGEAPTVGWEEVRQLIKVAKNIMQREQKHIPLIVGTGTNDTLSTVRRTEMAGQLGADAALIVVPYYSKPSQAGILEHFRRASQVGLPTIAYEVPSRTGVKLTPDTARRMLDLHGIIGLKDSTGGLELLSELIRCGTKPVLCGDDPSFYAMLRLGASGGMLASANVHTHSYIDIYNDVRAGNTAAAKRAFDRLLPFIELLFRESNPVPLKWTLARQETIQSDHVRLPLASITKELQADLAQELQHLGR
jgi:4-hydroxy-tetrahydrodipicolinate synthase